MASSRSKESKIDISQDGVIQWAAMMEEWTDPLLGNGEWWQVVLLALIGACIGSFLNVAIYRIPRGMSVNNPPRSFCPTCNAAIPWYLNLPIISWIMLRGKSACCHKPISPRYLLIECACFLLFGGISIYFDYESLLARLLICLWSAGLLCLLIMDWEFMVVHSRISGICTACGLLASVLAPTLVGSGTLSSWEGLLWGCAGVVCGYVLFRLTALVGRLLFGRHNVRFSEPTHWELRQIGDNLDIELVVGNHSLRWGMIFAERRGALVLEDATVEQVRGASCRVRFTDTQMIIGDSSYDLEKYDTLCGTCRAVSSQGSSMGSGDAWIAMAIGSLCGWQGVFFSLVVGSYIGLIFALIMRVRRGDPMPFGPSLILAAFLWLFTGPQLVSWFLNFLG